MGVDLVYVRAGFVGDICVDGFERVIVMPPRLLLIVGMSLVSSLLSLSSILGFESGGFCHLPCCCHLYLCCLLRHCIAGVGWSIGLVNG